MTELIKNIKVSVLLPIYNTEEYISEAVDSILDQMFHDFELIISMEGCLLERIKI